MGTISGGAAGDAKPSGTLSSPSPPSESPWRDAPGAPNAECQQEGAGERVGAGAGGQGPSRLAASHLRGQRPHGGGSRPAPPGWEHLPHGHDLSGLISPPRAGCRPWTSTSHRGDNSEKSVLRCGVVGEGSWTSHRRGDIGAGPCRWRSDPCAWPASAHGLRSVPPFFYRWIMGLSLGPGPDETW